MTSVVIYTANFGGRDTPRAQVLQQSPNLDVRYLYYTDGEERAPEPWQTFPVYVSPNKHPNLAAKWYKTHPPGIANYDYALWIDANMEMRIPNFAELAIASVSDGIAVWRHPRRDNILDEMEASLGEESQGGRYDHLPLRAQVEHYIKMGFPLSYGLYALGTIVWTSESAEAVGEPWYSECVKWSYQDQLSFPFVCWRRGIKPGVFPMPQATHRSRNGGWWANEWMLLHDHVGADR